MVEWLRDTSRDAQQLSFEIVCARVALGWAAGFVVAGVYVLGMGRRKDEAATLPTTLVLLTIIITMVTMVIGSNLARAFGLVGALSIVRFRTVVEDTRDTAFVIFAVVIGMAVGAGYPLVAAVGIPAVLLAAAIMQRLRAGEADEAGAAVLTVRLGLGHEPDGPLTAAFDRHLAEARLVGTGTARQGACVELTYRVRLRTAGGEFALVADLNRVEGVQGVELKTV